MNPSTVSTLRCPNGCESELSLHAERLSGMDDVVSGGLTCPECRRDYPIERGILRMLPAELCSPHESGDHAVTRKRTEMRARDSQVKDYEHMWYLNWFGLLEIPVTLRQLRLSRKHRLLEAGCGTGRMTREFASKCSRLVSVDFSWDSLCRCKAKLRRAGIRNVDLIQADICRLPLRSESFDRVVSCQVLEHIPTPECRKSAVNELARVLRNGERLVISAYQHSILTRLFGEKEGAHDGGIYFYRFRLDELKSLLSHALEVEAVTGKLVYHYIARCRKP